VDEKRLLVLDDDLNVGQTIHLIARSAGFSTSIHTRPEGFFSAVADWQPTHIILDLIMPDMDGVEVISELARHGCSAQIIITSGVGNRILDAAGRSATQHGLDLRGVLSKPFHPSALIKLLRDNDPATLFPGNERSTGHDSTTTGELASAIAHRHFTVAYQPKIECHSGLIAGFEALARWRDPKRGIIMPDAFIPLAEENLLIGPLTDLILEEALTWFSGLERDKYADVFSRGGVTLSINLSPHSLTEADLADRMAAMCHSMKVDTRQIIFEITETSAMKDPVASLALLTRLRMKGFHLAIDDFGTGFSSMVQLVRLPFSEIKVDRSFVIEALTSPESRAVTQSVIDLGQSLGLKVTAEGVENRETLTFLRDAGCELAQGFHIARPMDENLLTPWLTQYRPAWEAPAVGL